MSIYHKDKCTKEEATQFKSKVLVFLNSEKLPYTKVLALRSYNGQVRVYTGDIAHRLPLRPRRKLMAFKTPNGQYEGDSETIQELKIKGGDYIYKIHSEPIPTKDYIPVFRCDNWEEEKEVLKDKLKRK